MNEKYVDRAIRRALGQDKTERVGACPDHNLLAAYLEGHLNGCEKEALEAHAAECPTCQHVLALAEQIAEEPDSEALFTYHPKKKLLFRISIPISALALTGAAVAIGVFFLRISKQPTTQPPVAQTAELHAPAQVAPPPPANLLKNEPLPGRSQTQRPDAEKSPIRQRATALKEKETGPALKMPTQQPPLAATPVAATQIADLPAEKPETRRLAAARVDYAPARNENVNADQVMPAKAAAGGVAGGVVGGVIGGVSREPQARELQKVAALSMSMTETPRDAVLESSREQGQADASRWKKVADRGFRFIGGYWVDEQCSKNVNAAISETKEGAPEFEEILKLYPDLRALRPAVIFWKEKIWVLR